MNRFSWLAAVGTALWLVAAAASAVGWLPLALIEELFLLSPLIVVPLALEILHDAPEFGPIPSWLREVALIAGIAALAAFAFPRGIVSGMLAAVWALVTLAVGAIGLSRVARHGAGSLSHLCFVVACLYLPVGGMGLVMSRLGITSLGFEEPIVLLTAVHFHNSGFAAPILAGVAAERFQWTDGRLALRIITAGILATPALIAAGFVYSPLLKLIAVIWLGLSLAGFAAISFMRIKALNPGLSRALITVSAASVIVGMVLSSIYAAGEFAGREWISIPTMAITHGILNGVGFVLCGLLGWTLTKNGRLNRDVEISKNNKRKEQRLCASPLRVVQDSSAVTWRDGWSN